MKRLTALLIILIVTSTVHALNLEEARDLALANSSSLTRFQLSIESSVLDGKIQGYSYLPSLSLGLSASANILGEQSIQDTIGTGVNLGLSQKIFDGGKAGLLKSINKLSTGMIRQDALAEYFAVLNAADAAYFGVLEAEAALEAAEADLEAAALALSIAEIRRTGGMLSEGDYLRTLAEKESKAANCNQAQRDLTLGIAKLKILTGLTEIRELSGVDFSEYEELIQKLSTLSEDAAKALTLRFWETAAANNPGMIKAGLQVQQADQSVSLARRDYFPSLNAGISAGIGYSPLSGLDSPTGRISLSGNIPLDFWITAANVSKRKIAQNEAVLEYRNAEISLDTEIQTAILDLISLALSALSSRRANEYAQRHYEQVLELYKLSQSSVSALSDAAALTGTSRAQYNRSQYGFLTGLSKLRSLGCFSSEEELFAILLSS
jgi:outer membrane protein TolC